MTDEEAGPLLDAAHLADLIALDQGKGAVFIRFADLFVARSPARIAELKSYAKSGDLANLAESAHTLRGAAGNVGAFRLAVLLGRIEAAGKTGDAGAANECLALLDAEYEGTRTALLAAASRKTGSGPN